MAATKIKVSLMENCSIHWNVEPHNTINTEDRQCKYKRNTEARFCNHCCHEIAISFAHSE